MVTNPKSRLKIKTGQPLPAKTVKKLPKNYHFLFSDFTDVTIENWVKKKVCFGDKLLFKYISEYSRENIKRFRNRVQRLYPKETFEEASKVLITESIRPMMHDIIDELSKFLKPMGDLIISGGEAVNFYLKPDDRIITTDIDTKFVPKMKPDGKYFGKLQAIKLLLWNKLGQIAGRDNYKLINKVLLETDQYFDVNKYNYKNSGNAFRTNWAWTISKYIGLTSASGAKSKGYHVTRRYSLIPKRKNVKNGSNVLIDVELFTLDMKFRMFDIKSGKLEDINFGGILDIAFMRPKQIGYNVAKKNFNGANIIYANNNKNTAYKRKYKYLTVPSKDYLIEDIYMMQKMGLRPTKRDKDRKRMIALAREITKKKILGTDTMDTIAKKVGLRIDKPVHAFRSYKKVGPHLIKKATKVNPRKYTLSTTTPSKPKLSKDIVYGLKSSQPTMKTPPNYIRTQSNHIFNMGKMTWKPNPNQSYIRNEMNFRPIKPKPLPSNIRNISMEETLYGFKPKRDAWVPKPLLEKSAMIPFIGLKK
tara:strand:+ start:11183 stop:12775 length:1593 start_codon:yes stop_codon:yes gene_type:complete